MKINNLKKAEYISIIILMVIVLSNALTVYANQKTDLKNEQSNIDKQIEETNSEIAGVKSQMTDALNQINKYNSQIGTYENEIGDLQAQISTLQTQITEKQANIQQQQKKYEEQQELLEKRLVAMYESGTTSYLDMLLSSDGLADFISKYYIIEQLTEYDTELLKNIENTKNQIQNEKNELESSKKQVETSKTAIESKKNSLTVLVSEKNVLVGNLSEEEKNLQAELEEFEQDKRDIQRQLAAIAAQEEAERKAALAKKNQNSGSSSATDDATPSAPSTSGYICPLAGRSRSDITTGYYGYSGHTGVDFARNSKGTVEGKPVLAAKAGKVVTSTALKRPNGTYKSYGEYIVISHGDGTMTLYAHMQAGSRTVSPGTQVAQGQVIGKVGSTGNSTGPHLHFEVWVNGRRVNPTQYLP